MDKIEFKGNAETQKLARWMANLLNQRGFSFGIESEVVLGQDELADYLLGQGEGQDRVSLIAWIEQAVADNAQLFSRRDADCGVEYVAAKRKLVELFRPARPTPPIRSAAARPAAPPAAKEKPAAPEPAEAAPPAGEPPVTQQYQLAILQALHKLGGAGKTADVAGEIRRCRHEARDKHGWIMDTYLMRKTTKDGREG